MIPLWARLCIFAAICSVCFGSGWTVHSWKTDSENLAAVEAVQKTQTAISVLLENKLKDLKANERVITVEIPKIINRDVYHNSCLDNDGLLLINQAKNGAAKPAR